MAIILSGDHQPRAAGTPEHVNHTYVWMISLVAALGGLLFGYDWVVIGGAAKFYEAFFHLNDTAAIGGGRRHVLAEAGGQCRFAGRLGAELRVARLPGGRAGIRRRSATVSAASRS